METIVSFIKRNKIRMTAEQVGSNPNIDAESWGAGTRHWRCLLRRGPRRFTVPFSQGSAHTEPPTVDDVLDCLASDAAGYENAPEFEDWAGEYGYDTDSRRAERIYKCTRKQSRKLKHFLGDAEYAQLLWEVERQ